MYYTLFVLLPTAHRGVAVCCTLPVWRRLAYHRVAVRRPLAVSLDTVPRYVAVSTHFSVWLYTAHRSVAVHCTLSVWLCTAQAHLCALRTVHHRAVVPHTLSAWLHTAHTSVRCCARNPTVWFCTVHALSCYTPHTDRCVAARHRLCVAGHSTPLCRCALHSLCAVVDGTPLCGYTVRALCRSRGTRCVTACRARPFTLSVAVHDPLLYGHALLPLVWLQALHRRAAVHCALSVCCV